MDQLINRYLLYKTLPYYTLEIPFPALIFKFRLHIHNHLIILHLRCPGTETDKNSRNLQTPDINLTRL